MGADPPVYMTTAVAVKAQHPEPRGELMPLQPLVNEAATGAMRAAGIYHTTVRCPVIIYVVDCEEINFPFSTAFTLSSVGPQALDFVCECPLPVPLFTVLVPCQAIHFLLYNDPGVMPFPVFPILGRNARNAVRTQAVLVPPGMVKFLSCLYDMTTAAFLFMSYGRIRHGLTFPGSPGPNGAEQHPRHQSVQRQCHEPLQGETQLCLKTCYVERVSHSGWCPQI